MMTPWNLKVQNTEFTTKWFNTMHYYVNLSYQAYNFIRSPLFTARKEIFNQSGSKVKT